MKRTSLAVLVVALALVGLLAPVAFAQAPAPKVSINGLIDNVTAYTHNAINASGLTNAKDSQWYGRIRGRLDFIGEVGKAKGVLGIELDHTYGQTGSNDSSIAISGPQAGATSVATQPGTDGGFDLNTDSRGIIEIKWLYVEFPVPLIPVPTTARLGAQPFGAAANYKLAVYANGDFPGVNVVSQVTPNVKIVGTYVQIQESLVGIQSRRNQTGPLGYGGTGAQGGVASFFSRADVQNRGDDFAVIGSLEITPFKGLDIKPMYSLFYAQGGTDGNARQGRGGLVAGGSNAVTGNAFNNADGTFRGGVNEYRHTVGVDGRLRMGPFSFDPTVLYQFGNRAVVVPSAFAGVITNRTAGSKAHANLDAWLVDLREGFQLGPLLIEALQVYSTGNKARNSTLGTVRYFQPLDTDTSYLADWGTQVTSLGVDYINTWNSAGARMAYPGAAIGWDKYGRGQLGLKATYAITPALSIMAGANGHWTAEGMDRDGTAVAGGGIMPNFAGPKVRGTSHFVGTEYTTLLSWRFADGLVWDNAFGYLMAGKALDAVTANLFPAAPGYHRSALDTYILSSRVRFTF